MAAISAAELPGYLRERRVVADGAEIAVMPLGGGISAVVLLAEWDGGAVVARNFWTAPFGDGIVTKRDEAYLL
jgi:hypothetical protein